MNVAAKAYQFEVDSCPHRVVVGSGGAVNIERLTGTDAMGNERWEDVRYDDVADNPFGWIAWAVLAVARSGEKLAAVDGFMQVADQTSADHDGGAR